MRSLPAVIVFVAVVAISSRVAAQPGITPIAIPEERPAPEETEETYRGWIVGTSAASLGLFGLGLLSEGEGGRDTEASNTLFSLGMGGFVLSGPTVHVFQGNWRGALGSLGLRLFVPGLTMVIAVATADCDELFCELDRMAPGWVAGAALATIIDAAFLAKKKKPRESPSVLPYAGASRNGGLVGVSGRF